MRNFSSRKVLNHNRHIVSYFKPRLTFKKSTFSEEFFYVFGDCQGSPFIPRSSLRQLSGRVAHHLERLPGAFLFHVLRPEHPANCLRPTSHKATLSSCAATQFRSVPVDGGSQEVVAVTAAHFSPEVVRTAQRCGSDNARHRSRGRRRYSGLRPSHRDRASRTNRGKAPEAVEGVPDWPRNDREFWVIITTSAAFSMGSFHLIVIVAPPRVSKFHRRSQKLTSGSPQHWRLLIFT
jgi:hypothetical protein